MLRRCRRHKELRRCSVQILNNFGHKCFRHKVTKKCANKLRRSMHRRCLRDFHCFFNNPPSSPCLRVTFRQKPNLKWQTLSLQNPETLK